MKNIILMAIKPQYVKEIFNGRKQVEFRKRRFRKPVSHVVIYESGIKRIMGYFTINQIQEGSPIEIWDKYKYFSGMKQEEYFSYFSGCNKAIAIEINQVFGLSYPISLRMIKYALLNMRAPRSFYYISERCFQHCLSASKGYRNSSPFLIQDFSDK